MAKAFHQYSRRSICFGAAGAALGGVSVSGLASCRAADLPPGVFEMSTIGNPKNRRYYADSYTAPVGVFEIAKLKLGGQPRKYHFYLPRGRAVSAVLLLLHGSGRNGAAMIDSWRRLADEHGLALVAPDSFNSTHWSFESDGFDVLRAMVQGFMKANALKDLPIYGFGHSAGAVMLTHLSVRHGDYFTAVSVHAGNPPAADIMRYESYRKPRAPLTHILGDKDHIFKMPTAQATSETLSAFGQDVNLIIIKNHDHWYYDLAPFINKTAWAQMSAQPVKL